MLALFATMSVFSTAQVASVEPYVGAVYSPFSTEMYELYASDAALKGAAFEFAPAAGFRLEVPFRLASRKWAFGVDMSKSYTRSFDNDRAFYSPTSYGSEAYLGCNIAESNDGKESVRACLKAGKLHYTQRYAASSIDNTLLPVAGSYLTVDQNLWTVGAGVDLSLHMSQHLSMVLSAGYAYCFKPESMISERREAAGDFPAVSNHRVGLEVGLSYGF